MLDEGTFKGGAEIIVNEIKRLDERAGAWAEEYIKACVNRVRNPEKTSAEDISNILDKGPRASETTSDVVFLVAELLGLSSVFLLEMPD